MIRTSTSQWGLALPVALALLAYPAVAQNVPSQPLNRMSEQEVRRRADDLLGKMTSAEKVGQLSVVFAAGPTGPLTKQIQAGDVGAVLFAYDPATTNELQHAAVETSRLHIPLLFGFDVIHGLRTVFPVPIAMAASWDPDMVERSQATAAEEARAVGIQWVFSPMVDIARDPRWGRIVESAGEDPYLGSAMAIAQVRGFQGPFVGAPGHVLACVKHFAGYGAAEGGRDYDSVDLSDDQLWNVYFPPFRSAVRAGVGSLMSAYMDLNGVPATGNRWLLHDVLRDQWSFKGFVVSDNLAVRDLKTHGFAADLQDAAVRAFDSGVNMEMSIGNTAYSSGLPAALKQGRIIEKQLDEAVRPILETKLRLGLFEHPFVDAAAAEANLTATAHKDAARAAAERSSVLLRNEGSLLPLKAGAYRKIAVLGPLADSKPDINGSWVFASSVDETVTILSGLKAQAGQAIQIQTAPGVQIARKFASPMASFVKGTTRQVPWTDAEADAEFKRAVQLASESDLAVMVLGEAQDMSGEFASRSSLELPGRQEQLLEAVVAIGKPVVLVLLNGRPLDLTWASAHAPAILDVWYPGTQGGNAVANLLFGKASPGGKLPFTWPRNVGQVPTFYAHNLTQSPSTQGRRYWNEESTPLYPFGYGLSYAAFNYTDLQVDQTSIRKGASLTASVQVENTAGVAGDSVVQLYLHQQYGTSSRPVRELKGFQRITLAAHEKKTVRFTLGAEDLSYWSSATHSVVQDATKFDLWAGADSTAKLHAEFSVEAAEKK